MYLVVATLIQPINNTDFFYFGTMSYDTHR